MSAQDCPLVSLVIPVYNVEDYLPVCIDSISKQTFGNFEVILVDDGSSDRSGHICAEICQKDKRFRVIHKSSQGPGMSRNYGLRKARGRYIGFIDADDYVSPQMLETMVREIEKNDADLAIVDFFRVYDTQYIDAPVDYSVEILNQDQLFEGLFVKSGADFLYIVVWNKLYKRELINDLIFVDRNSSEDKEFNSRVYLRVNKAVKINKQLYYYRQWAHSLTGIGRVTNQWRIDNLESVRRLVLAIPHRHAYWRSLGLWRLYMWMLNERYTARRTAYQREVKRKMKEIYSETTPEFYHSKYITRARKLAFFMFYKFPFSYNAFVNLCVLRSRLKF